MAALVSGGGGSVPICTDLGDKTLYVGQTLGGSGQEMLHLFLKIVQCIDIHGVASQVTPVSTT